MKRIPLYLSALALFCGSALAAADASSCDKRLPWLKVDGPYMRQESNGDIVMLRGINIRIKGLFDVAFDDGRLPLQEIPSFDRDDPILLKEAGFNYVRLPISWSGLEPVEGQFSISYLDQLQSVVRQLNEVGIYVLIDFHQDAYSKEIGEDGAPDWAIIPALKNKMPGGPLKPQDFTLRRLSPTTLNAFRSFFENKENIQDRFWPAWRKVITTFQDCPGVVGFEPMNEPVAGHLLKGDKLLQNFYEGALREMRTIDTRHSLWLGPDYFNFLFTRKGLRDEPFTDDQIVFAPHLYPNLNPLPGNQGGTDIKKWRAAVKRITRDYEAIKESYGTKMMAINEWGMGAEDIRSPAYTQAGFELIYERNYPSAFWLWKEASHERWGYFDYEEKDKTWTLNEKAMKNFSLPMVLRAPADAIQQSFDFKQGQLKVNLSSARSGSDLLVYLPKRWYPEGPILQNSEGQRRRLTPAANDHYLIPSAQLLQPSDSELVFMPAIVTP